MNDQNDWKSKPFDACVVECEEHHKPIQRNQYLKTGKFPVVDQGQDLIGGYTDDEKLLYSSDLPLIVFGDHTRTFKYIDFPFAAGADGAKILKPNSAIYDPKFLFFALKFIGVPSRGYNRHFSVLREQEIPWTKDKNEQQTIAGILTKINDTIEIQDKTIATLKELKAATMERLLSEPCSNGWSFPMINDYFDVGNGSTPSRTTLEYWSEGTIPWINSSKIHEIIIRSADQFVTDKAKKECHLPLVPKGSLVVAITGQGKTLGNVAKVAFNTCINQHLAYLRPKGKDVDTDFLLAYLQTRYTDLRQAGSSGGTTKGALTCGYLETYSFPLPSKKEQQFIARTWRFLTRRIHLAEKKRRLLDEYFSTSLTDLMSGRLRTNSLGGIQ